MRGANILLRNPDTIFIYSPLIITFLPVKIFICNLFKKFSTNYDFEVTSTAAGFSISSRPSFLLWALTTTNISPLKYVLTKNLTQTVVRTTTPSVKRVQMQEGNTRLSIRGTWNLNVLLDLVLAFTFFFLNKAHPLQILSTQLYMYTLLIHVHVSIMINGITPLLH